MKVTAAVVVLLLAASGAAEAVSGSTLTPDSRTVLVSKEVSGLQWAIAWDPAYRTATGNVFDPAGGEPQFVWCEQASRSGDDQVTLDCYGTYACTTERCPDQWERISSPTLPLSFFAAGDRGPQTVGLEGLLGGWDFVYRPVISYVTSYDFQRIDTTSSGVRGILGKDNGGGTVAVFRVQDVYPGSTIKREFTMLDPGTIICRFYLFDRVGDLVTGTYYQIDSSGTGSATGCDTKNLGSAYGMDGVRLAEGTVIASDRAPVGAARDREILEMTRDATTRMPAAEPRSTDRGAGELLRALVERMESR